MPGTVESALCVLCNPYNSHIIPHFRDEETETQSNFSRGHTVEHSKPKRPCGALSSECALKAPLVGKV